MGRAGNGTVAIHRGHWITVAVLVTGYTGYYFCRSNLAVLAPQILSEMEAAGASAAEAKVRFGTLVSLGTLAYAVGKFTSGPLGDRFGGRSNFLFGMAGSALATVAFALSGTVPLFQAAWVSNRLAQSFGWTGIVRLTGRWFPFSAHGRVMAILSLSFLFGDAVARGFMGFLLDLDLSWRSIFFVNAALLGSGVFFTARLLRESPPEGALPSSAPAEGEVPAAPGDRDESSPFRTVLSGLLRQRGFWIACGLSLALTLLREALNTWTVTFLRETMTLSPGEAARISAGFPLIGGFSVLLAGFLADRLGRPGRAAVIVGGLLLTSFSLAALARVTDPLLATILLGLAGFGLMGPYSYLAGSVALDFGGRHGSATACGIIDGMGYLAGILAGDSVARLAVLWGWPAAFQTLAVVGGVAVVVGLFFWIEQRRPRWRAPVAGLA